MGLGGVDWWPDPEVGGQRAPISPHQELETGGCRPPEFLEDEGWGKGVGLEGLVGKDQ